MLLYPLSYAHEMSSGARTRNIHVVTASFAASLKNTATIIAETSRGAHPGRARARGTRDSNPHLRVPVVPAAFADHSRGSKGSAKTTNRDFRHDLAM